MADSIAKKEFERERKKKLPIIPYSSIQIYAENKDILYALKTLVTVKEKERRKILEKVKKTINIIRLIIYSKMHMASHQIYW
jgi:hypothetical protein